MVINPIWQPVLENLARQPEEALPLESQRNIISNAHFMAESLFQATDMLALIAINLEKPGANLSTEAAKRLAQEIRHHLSEMGALQMLSLMAIQMRQEQTATRQ